MKSASCMFKCSVILTLFRIELLEAADKWVAKSPLVLNIRCFAQFSTILHGKT